MVNKPKPDAPAGPARKQAVIYARVSSKEQEKEGFSIPAQLKLLKEYAAATGFEVAHDYVDVETAKRSGRSGFGEMLAYLQEAPDVRAILVEKTDRLYRNFRDWVTIDELDLDLHFVKEGVVLTPDARSSEKFIHGIKVLMAKNYIDNLSEETRKGMSEKAEQGIWPSFAPLGYRNVEGGDGKRIIEPDPAAAPIIVDMFHWYARGDASLKAVALRARQAGFTYRKSGDQVPTSTVHKLLQNPIYMGEFDWNGRRYRGRHEPIISADLWRAVQVVMRQRAASKRRCTRADLTYWGLISCGACGCAVVGETKKERYVYYRPTRYADRCVGACGRAYVREEVFDAQVEGLLNSLRFDAEVIEWLTSALKESCAEEKRFRDERSARLRQEHDRLQARIEQAYLDKLDGRIDAVLFDRMAGEWRAAQERCRLQIADFLSANASYYDDGLRLLELARSAADLWKRQTRAEKRKLLGFLVSNCTLAGDQLTFELRQPFDLLREKLQMSERLGADNRADFRDFENWLPG